MLSKVVAYRISPSSIRLREGQCDLVLKSKERIQVSPEAKPPKFIHLSANSIIDNNDLPSNDKRLPIFSKVALGCLEKKWKYSTINIHIAGQEVQEWVALHVLEYTDALDLEVSEYDEDDLYPNGVGYIHKMIFKRGVEFPPIFRIEEDEGIFVTPKTRLVWDINNISGIKYYPIFSS